MHEHKHCGHKHKEGHGPGYKGICDSDRRKMMDPHVILPKIGLKPGMTLVDVGCGQGFFALPAARIAGPEGRVYGIDIDAEALDLLSLKASDAGLNINALRGDAGQTVACEGCADIVFFGISLHDFTEPEKVLDNAWRMLKPGGVLADLDGKNAGKDGGSRPGNRLSEKEASQLIEEANFNIVSVEDFSDRFYLILAKK
ncbi:class I SAM-dependent methyltransferase [Methanocella sp. MCL-LM]|uniref:class I SAM-dependent methyltransferase n=1 Tax=Methanocella sp. MCL-LM TaxID=3412035 RepID=UPI003C7230EB